MPLTKGSLRKEDQKRIRKNLSMIKHYIDANDLTDYFIENEIFDFPDVERITGYNPNTKESRNNCFLQMLLNRVGQKPMM